MFWFTLIYAFCKIFAENFLGLNFFVYFKDPENFQNQSYLKLFNFGF